jgi:hypothetical protein
MMPRIVAGDYTFVTNNAADFRRLYGQEGLHAGLVIIVPQVPPARQRELFNDLLAHLGAEGQLVNEVIEIVLEGDEVQMISYNLPPGDELRRGRRGFARVTSHLCREVSTSHRNKTCRRR